MRLVPGSLYVGSAFNGGKSRKATRTRGGMPQVRLTGTWGGAAALGRLKQQNAGFRRIRCRIEKVFGSCKRSYDLRRMRWLGLAKAGLQVRLAAITSARKATASISPHSTPAGALGRSSVRLLRHRRVQRRTRRSAL